MGADFTYSLCPKEVDEETAKNRLLSLTKEQLIRIAENCCEEDMIDEDDDELINSYRDILLDDLNVIYGDSREIDILKLDNKTYVITGGMSYGDEPTDSYRPVWRISETGVTDTEENWNKMKEEL